MTATAASCYSGAHPGVLGGEKRLFVLDKAIGLCDTNAGVNPSFVDIQTTAVHVKNFKPRVPPEEKVAVLTGTDYPAKSSQLRKG